jgi:hypothetical protein
VQAGRPFRVMGQHGIALERAGHQQVAHVAVDGRQERLDVVAADMDSGVPRNLGEVGQVNTFRCLRSS